MSRYNVFFWKLVIQQARVYLLNRNLVGSPVPLPGYHDFCKRVMFHIRNHGYAGAAPLLQAHVELFKSWGLSEPVLRGLARLPGVAVTV
jgi:hypothetical protein